MAAVRLLLSLLPLLLTVRAYNERTENEVLSELRELLDRMEDYKTVRGLQQPRVEYPAEEELGVEGPQSITGGASEGVQHLGPAGNIPNLWAAMVESDNNRKPDAYPNPPNPCPKGYTAEDGCIEDMPDTADFSRLYQAREEALRGGQEEGAPYSSPRGPGGAPYGNELNELEYYLNPYRAGEKREAVVAKKSPLYLRRRRSLGLSSAVAMETDEREVNIVCDLERGVTPIACGYRCLVSCERGAAGCAVRGRPSRHTTGLVAAEFSQGTCDNTWDSRADPPHSAMSARRATRNKLLPASPHRISHHSPHYTQMNPLITFSPTPELPVLTARARRQ
ncbi:Neuroendocrine protein 7B2 [Branchiostoma belcheri]|nr:Neuroendocrine protein 7B2 [Branchiostoma belcheri]